MSKKFCQVLAFLAILAALVGYATFSVHPEGANMGVFIFPCLLAVYLLYISRNKD